MNTVEVCLSPALYPFKSTISGHITVVIDVLRATTSFCAAFDSGINSIVPATDLDELRQFKNKGYLTAAEREGVKVDFADFGNSPTVFLQHDLKGKDLAYSTTNGTKAIQLSSDAVTIAVACFANLHAVSEWLLEQNKNIVILCSGWKNAFSLEDTLCAGALVELLQEADKFIPACDASVAALDLWMTYKPELAEMVQIGSHYQRLFALDLDEDLKHCFICDTSQSVPVWNGKAFLNQGNRPSND